MSQENMTLTAADCLALLEILDKVPTVGLQTAKRNIVLEQKLMYLGRVLSDASAPARSPASVNPFEDSKGNDGADTISDNS